MRTILPSIFLITLFTAPAIAQENSDPDWTYSVEPYLFGSSISGSASMGRVDGVPVDVSFSDILENLEMAAMVHFEAHHKNGWGMIFDYGFMDLGADTTVGFGGVIDASVRQGILEALVSRRIGSGTGTLEAIGGIRWWDNQVRASFDPLIWNGSATARINEGWVDPIVGLRWTNAISTRWQLRLRGDIGGFGVGSDFTWSASASGLYKMSDRFDLEIGYRAVDVDYDNGKAANSGRFTYNTTTQGPLLGLIIKF